MAIPFYQIDVPVAALLQVVLNVNGRRPNALVDTVCTSTLVTNDVVASWSGISSIKATDESELQCNDTMCNRQYMERNYQSG